MTSNVHDAFDHFCVLQALGLLSPSEERMFTEHLNDCPQCQCAVEEYKPLKEEGVGDAAMLPGPLPRTESGRSLHLKERMFFRARAAGIPLKLPVFLLLREAVKSRFFQATAVLALLVILGLAAFSWQENLAVSQAQEKTVRLTKAVEETHLRIGQLQVETEKAYDQVRQLAAERDQHGQLYEEIVARERLLRANLAALEEQYAAEMSASSALTVQLERAANELSLLEGTTKNQDQIIARQQNALAGAQARLSQQRESVNGLSAELRKYKRLYDYSAELLAASRDIRDLIGAKDLRVVDVMDVPGTPATATSLGRMFIADQRVLVFYAFDLPEAKQVLASAKSYQAWGYNSNEGRGYTSLGLFYQDNNNHRWVLHFEDPEIIKEINAVFVTVEPPGGSRRPSGQQLLYAMINKEDWKNFDGR